MKLSCVFGDKFGACHPIELRLEGVFHILIVTFYRSRYKRAKLNISPRQRQKYDLELYRLPEESQLFACIYVTYRVRAIFHCIEFTLQSHPFGMEAYVTSCRFLI